MIETLNILGPLAFLLAGVVFLYYMVLDFASLGKKALDKLDSPTGQSVVKGLIAIGGGVWALKRAHISKSEHEREIYLQLVREATELAREANDELETKKSKLGKFYDNPDWWKHGGDDDPPMNPRWKN